jgi:hypothetical protein
MEEFKPENLENRKQKRALVKETFNKAVDIFLKQKNSEPYNMIAEFGKEFQEKHPDFTSFVLYHDLSGSSLYPDQETGPLDTPDGEIQKFVDKLNKVIEKILAESPANPE